MSDEAPRRDEVARWIRRLRLEPAQKLMLMLVFDHAGPQEDGRWAAWPSMGVLAEEAGWSSTATPRKRLAELEELGHLMREGRERGNGSTTSNRVVLLPVLSGEPASPSPATGSAGGHHGIGGGAATGSAAHKPQGEAITGREARERAVANGDPLRLTYRRKVVPEPTAHMAVRMLREYARAADQTVQAWKPSGEPTEDLKRVLGAVLDHPEVDGREWVGVIRAVLARPWWEGAPSVGVVFGPRVVADNLRSPGRGGGKRKTAAVQAVDDKEERARRRLAAAGRL